MTSLKTAVYQTSHNVEERAVLFRFFTFLLNNNPLRQIVWRGEITTTLTKCSFTLLRCTELLSGREDLKRRLHRLILSNMGCDTLYKKSCILDIEN